MSGTINALNSQGTSLQFSEFAKLAQQGSTKVIRFLGGLDAQTVHEVAVTKSDHVGWRSRSDDIKQANDTTRTIFRNTIAAMFGGEDNIPQSVKDAMRLKDYGLGKPLTARRIMKVKTAIDRVMQQTFPLEPPRISAPGVHTKMFSEIVTEEGAISAQQAMNMGYSAKELSQLSKVADIYRQATGSTLADAQKAALDPKSDARRLMSYGGLFTADAKSFAKGLALMQTFSDWYENFITNGEGKNNNSITADAKLSIEKFVFEEISANPKLSMDNKNPDEIFGPRNNKAMQFIKAGGMLTSSLTMAKMPAEKRSLIFSIFSALGPTSPSDRQFSMPEVVIARVLKNPAKAAELVNSGAPLTREKIFNAMFSDLVEIGLGPDKTNREIDDVIQDILNFESEKDEATQNMDDVAMRLATQKSVATTDMFQRSGASLRDCINAATAGKKIPSAPGVIEVTPNLAAATGFDDAGQKQFLGDICRPSMPTNPKTSRPLLTAENNVFRINIGNQNMVAEKGEAPDNLQHNKDIAKTIANLCNSKIHPQQTSSVFFALSQSGLMPLTEITAGNYSSNEHGPVTMTLSKDAETGSIKIDYSNPVGSPVKFSWSATVDVEGNVTNTPVVIQK